MAGQQGLLRFTQLAAWEVSKKKKVFHFTGE